MFLSLFYATNYTSQIQCRSPGYPRTSSRQSFKAYVFLRPHPSLINLPLFLSRALFPPLANNNPSRQTYPSNSCFMCLLPTHILIQISILTPASARPKTSSGVSDFCTSLVRAVLFLKTTKRLTLFLRHVISNYRNIVTGEG
jgi:hypothetical protein